MSQENIDLVSAWVAGYNAGELDAIIDLCAPDIEVRPDASVFPEARPFVGRAEYRAFLESISQGWAAPHFVLKEALPVREDQVLARGDWGGTGRSSGIETYSNLSGVFTFRAGQFSRADFFFDHDKALEAVGLRE